MTADDRAYVDAHDLKILIELKKTEVRLTERMKFKSRKTAPRSPPSRLTSPHSRPRSADGPGPVVAADRQACRHR